MNGSVFISGSISIKKLPQDVIKSLEKIIAKNMPILVGDAKGVDALIQDFCLSRGYTNLTIYSIYNTPRYRASDKFKFKHIIVDNSIKKERDRQQEKDRAMTLESQFSFVIWDTKSKGSYTNILRAIEHNKKIKVYNYKDKKFIENSQIDKNKIESIYRENNGYTASEVILYLKNEINIFKRTQDLNKYLLEKQIIQKENKTYIPTKKYKDLFIIDKYYGKVKGIKFKNEFIHWIRKDIKEAKDIQQTALF